MGDSPQPIHKIRNLRNLRAPLAAVNRQAVRLYFRLHRGRLILVERQLMQAQTRASDPFARGTSPQAEQRTGSWVDLVDSSGKTVYRQVLHDPLGRAAEARNDDGELIRVVRARPYGVFSVLVPLLPQAHQVVVMDSPLDRPAAAQELGRFELRPEG
jgi:hypothetical protein